MTTTGETIQCDRCGIVIDAPYRNAGGTYNLCMSIDLGFSGDAIAWKELCEECNTHIGKVFHAEIKAAKRARSEI